MRAFRGSSSTLGPPTRSFPTLRPQVPKAFPAGFGVSP